MKNPICKNVENLEFIENNLEELSKSIGSYEYINEYYIDVFKHKKAIFNLEVFLFNSFWFGYRRMYLKSFLVPFFLHMILGFLGLFPATGVSFLTSISHFIVYYVFLFIIAKYANYKYFLTLKSRIINKNSKKYGKTALGAVGGGLLGLIGGFLGQFLVGIIYVIYHYLTYGSMQMM